MSIYFFNRTNFQTFSFLNYSDDFIIIICEFQRYLLLLERTEFYLHQDFLLYAPLFHLFTFFFVKLLAIHYSVE